MLIKIKLRFGSKQRAAVLEQQGMPRTKPRRAISRFIRNRAAVASTIFMMAIILVCFPLAPAIAPQSPNRITFSETAKSPTAGHPLGTDLTGRDILSRIVYGGRASLAVGIVAVAISATIGSLFGSMSGYFGGWVDTVITRITELFMAFPSFFLLITIVAVLGPGLDKTMVAIGILGWTGLTRLVRAQVLAVREMDYIMAARAMGAPEMRILFKHIFPNVISLIVIAGSFGVAGAILTEAGLSFLGLGVPPPNPSWGNMLNEAMSVQIIQKMPWVWLPPGIMVSLCVLAINFIGDGLRDALDPRAARG